MVLFAVSGSGWVCKFVFSVFTPFMPRVSGGQKSVGKITTQRGEILEGGDFIAEFVTYHIESIGCFPSWDSGGIWPGQSDNFYRCHKGTKRDCDRVNVDVTQRWRLPSRIARWQLDFRYLLHPGLFARNSLSRWAAKSPLNAWQELEFLIFHPTP